MEVVAERRRRRDGSEKGRRRSRDWGRDGEADWGRRTREGIGKLAARVFIVVSAFYTTRSKKTYGCDREATQSDGGRVQSSEKSPNWDKDVIFR